MKNELLIRQGEAKDIVSIAKFNILAAKESEGRELANENAYEGVKAVIEDSRKGFYLIAEVGSEMVGQLMVTNEWSDWSNRYFFWIQSVYVRKDFRNRKMFSALYRHLLEMIKSRDDVKGIRLYVEKNNRTAIKVYEALGMAKTIYDMYEISKPLANG
jgi:ribosomal protein S18 acetylase RimI-like enzyme